MKEEDRTSHEFRAPLWIDLTIEDHGHEEVMEREQVPMLHRSGSESRESSLVSSEDESAVHTTDDDGINCSTIS